MSYVVPNMKLISQKQPKTCWLASVQMLIAWKNAQKPANASQISSPELDAECQRIRDSNRGIRNPEIVRMAKRLGLQAIPPMSPTPQAIEGWLRKYGPLWVNGKNHIVVIAGIQGHKSGDSDLYIFDPSPVGAGSIDWRSLNEWYADGSEGDVDSRDTGRKVEAIFLHNPA